MRAVLRVAALSSFATLAVFAHQVSILHIPVPMKDGARLCTNVFLPSAPGRFPTLLVRTPYNKGVQLTPYYEGFVAHGYALVIQDVRGRYHSSGEFRPLEQEPRDGDETLNWIAQQPWSNGRIGMFGGSYLGIVQWRVAPLGNPHLKALFPVVSGGDEYVDRFYSPGGAMKLGHRLLWISENLRVQGFKTPEFSLFIRHLPLRTIDAAAAGQRVAFFQKALDHPAYDSYWKALSTREKLDQIRVPVFVAGGWYDNFVESDLKAFSFLRKRGGDYHVLIGPWAHNMAYKFPDADFGSDALIPLRTIQLAWFDRWLKPGTVPVRSTSEPPVRIFVMGINQWRHEQEWPLQRAKPTPMYLISAGKANTRSGDGLLSWNPPKGPLPPDQYTYDPKDPVPTMGGSVCCNPRLFPWGPMDQRRVEERRDVLVYTSDPFLDDIEVTGTIEVVLNISTSAPDTDFTAKLVDVSSDGHARNLCDGILRLRYREGLDKGVLAIPGSVYRISIDAGVTSNVFRAGHRIRVEISSSNFPRFDRNPNTGRTIATETELRIANQTIFHDRNRPSYILLPVIPAAAPTARILRAPGATLMTRTHARPAARNNAR